MLLALSDSIFDEAIQGFTDEKHWSPSLKFDPVSKAHQLAEEGGGKK
jgi:hypothetical protein